MKIIKAHRFPGLPRVLARAWAQTPPAARAAAHKRIGRLGVIGADAKTVSGARPPRSRLPALLLTLIVAGTFAAPLGTGPAATQATARRLRRALADAARAWALAAGVPPQAYPATGMAQFARHHAAGNGLASELPDPSSASADATRRPQRTRQSEKAHDLPEASPDQAPLPRTAPQPTTR